MKSRDRRMRSNGGKSDVVADDPGADEEDPVARFKNDPVGRAIFIK